MTARKKINHRVDDNNIRYDKVNIKLEHNLKTSKSHSIRYVNQGSKLTFFTTSKI